MGGCQNSGIFLDPQISRECQIKKQESGSKALLLERTMPDQGVLS